MIIRGGMLCPTQTTLRRGPDTSRGQKRQNPYPSSLRASDMFAGVQQLLSVHDNKLRSGTLLAFFGLKGKKRLELK